MPRTLMARPAPRPTSITEVARRYHACAAALAQTLGLSVPEVLSQHRESVTAIFIECGRCDLRLPAAVTLPPLATPPAPGQASEPAPAAPPTNGHTPPAAIPREGGLPCGGMAILALTPAQLAMLVSKVARLVSDGADQWVPLLYALQSERASRLEAGRQGARLPAEKA
jgi:hypothetical protein